MNQEHKIWSRVQNPPSKTRVHLLCNSTVRFSHGYTRISLSGFWLDNNLPENHAAPDWWGRIHRQISALTLSYQKRAESRSITSLKD